MVFGPHRRFLAALAAGIITLLAGITSARASVISSTPTLPVLDVPYAASFGVGCFPLAGACVVPGTITLTSLVSSTFGPSGQDIVANASYIGTLTTLAGVPIGPVNLSGTLEEEVIGRTSPTELGIWSTKLLALSLSGPALGHTLMVTLDPAVLSTGFSSIVPDSGQANRFRIDSFFDVFVELTLDGPTPLTAKRGPLHLSLVPEPSTWLLLIGGVAGLGFVRRRQHAA